METTFRECTDNGKKETVMISCSEMRTEGTSRPSAGMFPCGRMRQKMSPLQSVPALDFSLMTYLLCLVLYLMSYIL